MPGILFVSVKNRDVFAAGYRDVFTPITKRITASGAGQCPPTLTERHWAQMLLPSGDPGQPNKPFQSMARNRAPAEKPR